MAPLMGSEAVDRNCPVCGARARLKFPVHGFEILGCDACRHQFVDLDVAGNHVAATYDDRYFFGGGAGYSDYLAEGPMLRRAGRRYAQLLQRHLSAGRLLDVGSAAGFVLAGFVDSGWQGMGLEPNARMAAHGRESLSLDIRTTTLEQFDSEAEGGFDLVSMIQVIAHFHDLRQALDRARAATRPGGHWLIETWDNGSWTAQLLGRHWHEYSPPSVLHVFCRASLVRLAADYDMAPVAFGRPRKRISGAHVKSLLAYKLGDSAVGRLEQLALSAVPDRMVLPYPAEDLFWILLRRKD